MSEHPYRKMAAEIDAGVPADEVAARYEAEVNDLLRPGRASGPKRACTRCGQPSAQSAYSECCGYPVTIGET